MKYKCKLIKYSETDNESIDRFFRNRVTGEFIIEMIDGRLHLYDEDILSYKPDLYTSYVTKFDIVDKTIIVQTMNTKYEFEII